MLTTLLRNTAESTGMHTVVQAVRQGNQDCICPEARPKARLTGIQIIIIFKNPLELGHHYPLDHFAPKKESLDTGQAKNDLKLEGKKRSF